MGHGGIDRHGGYLQLLPAVVTRVCGTRSIYVRVVPNGPIWRRHYEQLRPRYGTREEDADPGSWSGPSLSGEQSAPPQSQPTAEPIVLGDRPRRRNPRYPSDDQYGIEHPRRSERIRQRKAADE